MVSCHGLSEPISSENVWLYFVIQCGVFMQPLGTNRCYISFKICWRSDLCHIPIWEWRRGLHPINCCNHLPRSLSLYRSLPSRPTCRRSDLSGHRSIAIARSLLPFPLRSYSLSHFQIRRQRWIEYEPDRHGYDSPWREERSEDPPALMEVMSMESICEKKLLSHKKLHFISLVLEVGAAD